MLSDRIVLILLGVWAALFGVLAVSNVRIVWCDTLMGFAALLLGIVCLIRALR